MVPDISSSAPTCFLICIHISFVVVLFYTKFQSVKFHFKFIRNLRYVNDLALISFGRSLIGFVKLKKI